MERGVFMAFGALVLWGILDVSSRYAVVGMGAHPFVFSCLNLLFGGLILILLGGRGWGSVETFKNPLTWTFGFLRVLMTLFMVYAFALLTTSEAGFMVRISTLISMTLAYFLFSRAAKKQDVFGIALMIMGFLLIALRQEGGLMNLGVLCVLGGAACGSLLNIIAERHPISNRAIGFKARARFTGVVLMVTSFASIVVALAINGAGIHVGSGLFTLPSSADMLHTPTIIAALLVGLLLRAPSMYMHLLSNRLLNAEMVGMIFTLATFTTLMAESMFGFLGLLDVRALDGLDVFGGVLMTLGGLSMAFIRFMQHKRKQEAVK